MQVVGPGSAAHRRRGAAPRPGHEAYPPAFSVAPRLTSSSSEDDTAGTCSPSVAREMAVRVLLNSASAPAGPAGCALMLLSSSVISTLRVPAESSPPLPGVADHRTTALSPPPPDATPRDHDRPLL